MEVFGTDRAQGGGLLSPREAMALLARRREVLSNADAGLYPFAGYDSHYDLFTNESGLAATARSLEVRGGAVVGVGGGVLELAQATSADLVVSVDVNPELAEGLSAIAASSPFMGTRARREGWDRARPGDEVRARMEAYPGLQGQRVPYAQVERELPSVGVSAKVGSFFATEDSWFHSEEAIERLAALILRGGLVLLTGDLGEPQTLERVSSVLAGRGSSISALYLSNALDYLPDRAALLARAGRLPLRADAVAVTTTATSVGLQDQTAPPLGTFGAGPPGPPSAGPRRARSGAARLLAVAGAAPRALGRAARAQPLHRPRGAGPARLRAAAAARGGPEGAVAPGPPPASRGRYFRCDLPFPFLPLFSTGAKR